MPSYNCQNCKKPFEARAADRARGWAKFCSKSCKAIKQVKRPEKKYHAYKGPKFHPHVDKETYLHYRNEYGGEPVFDRNGNYVGISMSPEDLSYGGHGDSGPEDPFSEGKY